MQDTTPYSGSSARMVTSPPSSMRGSTPPTGANRRKPPSSTSVTRKPIWSRCASSMTVFAPSFPQDRLPITLPFLSTSTVSQYGRNSSATAFAACISKPLTAGSAHSVRSVCSNCKEIPPFSSFVVQVLL